MSRFEKIITAASLALLVTVPALAQRRFGGPRVFVGSRVVIGPAYYGPAYYGYGYGYGYSYNYEAQNSTGAAAASNGHGDLRQPETDPANGRQGRHSARD